MEARAAFAELLRRQENGCLGLRHAHQIIVLLHGVGMKAQRVCMPANRVHEKLAQVSVGAVRVLRGLCAISPEASGLDGGAKMQACSRSRLSFVKISPIARSRHVCASCTA